MAMLPKTLTAADATFCTAPESHVYALSMLWGPTYPLLGYTPSILKNTRNDRDAHNV